MRNRQNTQQHCDICEVRDRTEWCALHTDELAMLDRAKVSTRYLPGQPIFHEGAQADGIHCIASGMVGVRKLDAAGNSILLRLAHAGETLGYRSFLAGGDHRTTTEALAPSVVCYVDGGTLRGLLARDPSLGLKFLNHAARDLDAAEEKVLQSATLTVRGRLAHLLMVLRDRYAVAEHQESFDLKLPLSRQDMAAMIGIRPESMSRTIRLMQQDGVAKFSGRTVHIPNVDRLLAEMDGDSAY